MPVFIHADFLVAVGTASPYTTGRLRGVADKLTYAELVTAEGIISEHLRREAEDGPALRVWVVEMSRALHLRRSKVLSLEFARFVTALDVNRYEFHGSTLTRLRRDRRPTGAKGCFSHFLCSSLEFQRKSPNPLRVWWASGMTGMGIAAVRVVGCDGTEGRRMTRVAHEVE